MEVKLKVKLGGAFLSLFLLEDGDWVNGWVEVCDPGFSFWWGVR